MIGNGKASCDDIIKVTTEGRRKFGFDALVIEVDVIAVANQYAGLLAQFQDETGKIPPASMEAANEAAWNFVRGVVKGAAVQNNVAEEVAMADVIVQKMSLTTALAFMARITEEGEKLRGFFTVATGDKPSSQPSTKLTFSE